MSLKRAAPPIAFDGRFYWYTEWFDPSDDRCSLCRGPIDEETVPLCLFKEIRETDDRRRKPETWQARFCEACTPIVIRQLSPPLNG
jgi:hypothetical protein